LVRTFLFAQRENKQNQEGPDERKNKKPQKCYGLRLGLRLGPHICLGLSVNQRKKKGKNELAMFK